MRNRPPPLLPTEIDLLSEFYRLHAWASAVGDVEAPADGGRMFRFSVRSLTLLKLPEPARSTDGKTALERVLVVHGDRLSDMGRIRIHLTSALDLAYFARLAELADGRTVSLTGSMLGDYLVSPTACLEVLEPSGDHAVAAAGDWLEITMLTVTMCHRLH